MFILEDDEIILLNDQPEDAFTGQLSFGADIGGSNMMTGFEETKQTP